MKRLKRLLQKFRDQQGFTLVELMVVVVIIGILAAIAIPQFSKQADKAKMGRAEAEMKSMANIINVYYSEKGQYPKESNSDTDPDSIRKVLNDSGVKWADSENPIKDPWDNPYFYHATTDDNGKVTKFYLYCYGSDKAAGQPSNITITGNAEGVSAPEKGEVSPITGVKSDGTQ
ncbi:prepilin-type N-terminal cleavage/methylation domain-containing protein [Desulfotomaculum nigrificans]|uniref:prepilin-type N-terminal cleavage/methylation domain-containing protein n=1 Tax=Desulfotomaculum nigrificans TaxID=1565 RepID=UPI0001FAE7DE|nr:prepilin-type N-terminal cleavage/methylation domain-containing protein [Desulfotomaculum nigrificans]